eukprot:scaffold23234_cov28-Tisochrysis_lutea.AAC.1
MSTKLITTHTLTPVLPVYTIDHCVQAGGTMFSLSSHGGDLMPSPSAPTPISARQCRPGAAIQLLVDTLQCVGHALECGGSVAAARPRCQAAAQARLLQGPYPYPSRRLHK